MLLLETDRLSYEDHCRMASYKRYYFTPELLKTNPDIIRKYDEPGRYILYLCSAAVHPDYYSSRIKIL
ncbi:MAG: hypothetical protein PHN75_08655 [Syntrophales bacterium]|nr:hypothetical protein [Syntrophales bacterium]